MSAEGREMEVRDADDGLGKVVVLMTNDSEQEDTPVFSPPGCLACGACCFSAASGYVPVKGDDWTRLGADAERWAVFVNNRAFMRMVEGHCAALRVEPEAFAVGEVELTFPQEQAGTARAGGIQHGTGRQPDTCGRVTGRGLT